MLCTQIETANSHDKYAVAVLFEELGTMGHIPKTISRLRHSFLTRGGVLQVQVLGRRKHSDLLQGGLDVQCMLIFSLANRSWFEDYREMLTGTDVKL